jgi:hypothetical protein
VVHLGYLVGASQCAFVLSCYQLAVFEQLGATLARVKDEPKLAHEFLTSALAALSAAQAIGRLKSALDGSMVAPAIAAKGSRLLARLSQSICLEIQQEGRRGACAWSPCARIGPGLS